MFEGFVTQGIFLQDDDPPGSSAQKDWRKSRLAPGTQSAKIVFFSIAEAEKALALLHLRNIPCILPPVPLVLSTSKESRFSGNPRIVKLLPKGYTELQLYELLRPFGCLAYVRIHDFGAVVQFWTESDAENAEVAVRTAFSRDLRITLQAYDPCKLSCANLSPEVNEESLENYFKKYGSIISVTVLPRQNGNSCGLGFVLFSAPDEASSAIKALHGTTWRSKIISVRYHEPKTSATIPAPANHSDSTPCEEKPIEDPPPPEVHPQYGIPPDPSVQETADDGPNDEEQGAQNVEGLRDDHIVPPITATEKEQAVPQAEIEGMRDQIQMLEKHNRELECELRDKETRIELLEERVATLLGQAEGDRDECENWRRKFLVADSRCKILELEADRPLWEEANRKRAMKKKKEAKRAEEARRKAEVEESERRMREFLAEGRRRELEEKRRKEQEEAARKAREQEERDKMQKERDRQEAWRRATESEQERCRKRDSRLPTRGSWTNKLALERFLLVSNEFEQLKFSESKPLTLGSIPWPTCDNPAHLSPEKVDWDMVEIFFSYVQSTYSVPEYNRLVQRIHRLFHPDKWQSRRILETVQDTDLRNSLGLAGNKVAQAMTPLWRKTKGYVSESQD
ncbi:Polyadenylate-binding protein, cytoplasmic and nuclear [Hypsizygus marmoreus]|uniref:Polyadenylate-binding protein, cytoplasmic and nuclear n=1 Tax=Hypsizygus marmoreus TaxID=39966 RepID=A0A369KAG2_HYPMA|nr:Polyadenylate-binding protein, cytoplasmic and nuclear [Hypsizygus marmoreus]